MEKAIFEVFTTKLSIRDNLPPRHNLLNKLHKNLKKRIQNLFMFIFVTFLRVKQFFFLEGGGVQTA
jgi:hypothetical protein